MSDLISKSETIDLLYQVFEKHSMATDKNDLLGGFGAELFKNIKAMPTAYSVDKGDMKHNLAEMYAKNMVDYGVDVTKAWQTATQQSYALEKAYIRGRQDEADRLEELKEMRNNQGQIADFWYQEGISRESKLIFDKIEEIKNRYDGEDFAIIGILIKIQEIALEIAEHLKVGGNS